MQEQMVEPGFPAGEYRDVLIGPGGRVQWETPWQRNLIVNNLRKLLAALVKGDPQGHAASYWAVGAGQAAWDAGPVPSEQDRRQLVQLYAETGRKAIGPGQIKFLGGAFTNQLEITAEFTSADIAGDMSLREFGLFAGGGGAANSGVLMNHRIHPRIDMQPGFTLQRTLRLTF